MKYFFLIFSLLIFTFFFYKGLQKDPTIIPSNLIEKQIPDFKLKKTKFFRFFDKSNLLEHREPTIINFFASWCTPCRDEHKYLVELSKNGAHIVGVSFKDKKSNTLDFLNQLGNPYKFIAADNDGKASISFGIYGIPESIIINSESVVVKKIIGPINQEIFKEILNIIK